jgi:hypothetical protein
MSSEIESLVATYLPRSRVSAALQVTELRCALELFRDDGSLLFVTAASSLEPAGVRGVWRIDRAGSASVLAVGTTDSPDGHLPLIRFEHRGRQLSAQLSRLGPFWLAEAAGGRVSVTVDNGHRRSIGRPRRRPGPLRLRSARTHLRTP